MRRIDHKIAYLLILIVFLGTGSAFAAKYFIKNKDKVAEVKEQVVEEIAPVVAETIAPTPVTSEAVKEQIVKAPPKRETKQTVTTTPSSGGQVTTISSGGLSQAKTNDYLSSCITSSSPLRVSVTDETERYSSTGEMLRQYLNGLRWGSEINFFCGIYITDAGITGWSGQYVASYQMDHAGHIVSAKGAIILNSSYYSTLSQNIFDEYMKLILSHEYGHHYTQYHKWIDLNLSIGTRFPDQYYNVRPLSKSATITDCSVSWSTCESEIIAEDYSYLYSGYGLHQMAGKYGYPSAATKTWLDSLRNAPSEPEQPAQNQNANTNSPSNNNANSNANSNTNVNNNTNSADVTKPVVTIIDPAVNPYAWNSSVQNLSIKIRSTDNIGIVKIKVYINDQFQGETTYAGADMTWHYNNAPAGEYFLKAEAYDAAGNVGEIVLTINKS